MYTKTNHIVFSADSAGELAKRRLSFPTRWRIQGVYRNCFYCQNEVGEILCIGTDLIDSGPFTIKGATYRTLLDSRLSTGTVLHSQKSKLYFWETSVCIDIDEAEIWDATFLVHHKPLASLEDDCGLLATLAHQNAPEESLGHLITEVFTGAPNGSTEIPFFSQLLHEKVRGVMKCIRSEGKVKSEEAITEVLTRHMTGLIGAGYGLTPSGDDFCCGVILGIARMHNPLIAKNLAIALSHQAVKRTTTLSLNFFRSLAEFRVSETQDRLLKHFGNSGTVDIRRIVFETASHGSTSGWDMLAGFVFGIDLFRKRYTASNLEYERGCVC